MRRSGRASGWHLKTGRSPANRLGQQSMRRLSESPQSVRVLEWQSMGFQYGMDHAL